MKKTLIVFAAGLLLLAACVPSQPATTTGPSVDEIVSATMSALTAAAPPTQQAEGNVISFQNVSFVLPPEVATSALAGMIAAVPPTTDGPGWDVAPEHIKFQLDNYQQYTSMHDAYILVLPAQEAAAMNEATKQSIEKLQALLNGSAALTAENLPTIFFFNAAQAFAAQIQVIHFNGGSGVRFLTEYAQYYATANNRDLFYQFQGLTSDGKYYIIAILPTSHPLLAMDPDPAITIPSGGIPFPGLEDQAGLEAYYPAVVNLLNSAAPNSFEPGLPSLDALIQSITITSQ